MKVTSIKKQVKSEGRYSIFVDGTFAFGLSELGLINSGIKVGAELSRDDLEGLQQQSEIDKLHNRALGLLARRPRSEWEMTQYLHKKGATKVQAETILNMLSMRGYLDDKEFATRWVESRRLLKPISRRKLQAELAQKRVNSQIIDEVLSTDETKETDVLREEVRKKRRTTKYQDDQKLMAYLARQGYSYGDIKEVLSEEGN